MVGALRRVCVLGGPGSGKSHLSRELADRTSLPHVELDRHFWRPGWVMPDEAAWRETQRALVAEPAWVVDGNYATTYAERLPLADTVVVLDTPRWRCLVRILRRRLRRRGEEVAPGCPERLGPDLLRYVWHFPRRSRPRLEAAVAALPAGVRVVRLRTQRDVRRFLADTL